MPDDLRTLAAEAIRAACPTDEQCLKDEEECFRAHPIHEGARREGIIVQVYATPEAAAAAVLAAVLPAHRRQVLDEVEDELTRRAKNTPWSDPGIRRGLDYAGAVVNALRRLADDTPPTPPNARQSAEPGPAVPEDYPFAQIGRQAVEAVNAIANDLTAMVRPFAEALSRAAPDRPADADAPDDTRLTVGARRAVSAVQRWMALDLWMALGDDPAAFDPAIDATTWADMWADLLGRVRRLDQEVTFLTESRDRWTRATVDKSNEVARLTRDLHEARTQLAQIRPQPGTPDDLDALQRRVEREQAAQAVIEAAKVRAQVLRDLHQFGSGSDGWAARDRESDKAILRAVDAVAAFELADSPPPAPKADPEETDPDEPI